jgi:rhamnogalacturonyl hydrolase YesR
LFSVALGSSAFLSALPIRTTVFSPDNDSAAGLFDLSPESVWTPDFPGDSVSVLLEDVIPLEAVGIFPASPGGQFELAASDNYRDWWRLAEDTLNESPAAPWQSSFAAIDARYLRFTALDATTVGWRSISAGSAEEVAADLETMQPYDWGDIFAPATIETMMATAFQWQWDRVEPSADNLTWQHGAFHTGIAAAYRITSDPRYRAAILKIGDDANWTLRRRTSDKAWYHADDHCMGQAWLELYEMEELRLPQWIEDVKMRIDWVMDAPLAGRTDYSWCDALFMAPPIYERLATITGDNAYRTYIDGQWWDVSDFLYDEDWQLYYRDSRYFGRTENNGSPIFWSRGNGWVIAGLVRMLDHMPQDWPTRAQYLGQFREMAARLAAMQSADDGLWCSSLLAPERFDFEPETSGSAFFIYAFAWGINEGLLDAEIYEPVVNQAWSGLTKHLTKTGELRYIQQVGAEPAKNNQLSAGKEYGYGAFLLAASEMWRLGQDGIPWSGTLRTKAKASQTSTPRSIKAQGSPDSWQTIDASWSTHLDSPSTGARVAEEIDPFGNPENMVFRAYSGSDVNNLRSYCTIPAIADGTTATLYQRFAIDDSIIDLVLGASDVATPSSYGDYETGLRLHTASNRFEARSGNTYQEISDDLVQLETWYEVWTVINNADDTYDVYVRGGSNFREQTLLRANIPFRNGTSQSILRYVLTLNPSQGNASSRGSVCFDDLAIDLSGVNLTRPSAVSTPRCSPWAELSRDRISAAKETTLGTLWDEAFPWIYHAPFDGWLWIPETNDAAPGSRWIYSPEVGWLYLRASETAESGIFAYARDHNDWWYLPAAFSGWYYSYGDEKWVVYGWR